MNEADTCRVLVTPALRKAGWDDPVWRMTEQHYFTDGQIVLVGDGHKRQKGKKADYLLRCEESFPIAVVEAKAEDLEPGAAGRNKILGVKKLEAIKVPLPPIEQQREFGELIRRIQRARTIHQQTAVFLEAFMSALLDQAFRGEL